MKLAAIPPSAVEKHSLIEDALAIIAATSFVALGLILYQKAMLMTGSSAGIALLIH